MIPKKDIKKIIQKKEKLPHISKCICPNCGHQEPYHPVTPCYTRKCPKCETPLTDG
jgi:hypothetical protein